MDMQSVVDTVRAVIAQAGKAFLVVKAINDTSSYTLAFLIETSDTLETN